MEDRYVLHPKFGRGKVISSRNNDFMLEVLFECGASAWIRLDKVTEEIPVKKERKPVITSSVNSKFFYRKMIEAFRLGIVPGDCIQEFMVGRENEIRDLSTWLDSDNNGSLILRGEYGSGKTHFVQYAMNYAMKQGYAASFIDMDPNETPFYKPKSIYAKLIRNLRYIDPVNKKTRNFRDLLRNIVSHGVLQNHEYFGCIDHKSLENEYVWEWIEGRSAISKPWIAEDLNAVFVPSLFDYGTAINIYCYLLTGLSWGAMQTLGLKGLLVIFDEAEIVDAYCYRYQIQRSHDSLKAFVMSANNDNKLLGRPSHTGLVYCGVGIGTRIPFIYRIPSGLKFMFALTPSCIIEQPYMNEIRQIELQTLSDNSLSKIIRKIQSIYSNAYNFSGQNSRVDSILRRSESLGGKTRFVVKGTVEALDIERLNTS